MTILVLGGGKSTEREVSLRSAKAVAEALRTAGYVVQEADPADGESVLQSLPLDTIVFPILHGAGGEDGEIQYWLEKANLPYLGTQSAQSVVCFDKAKTREVLSSNNLPVAEGAAVSRMTYPEHPLHNRPHVLKISQGGSSIGTYLVPKPEASDPDKVNEVFELGDEAVIEELVEGAEITVPILDEHVMPVIEIQPPPDQSFDYENKYNGATKELCPPVSIDQATQQRAQELALKAHQALGCRHLSRTDMIVRPTGEIVILETNTMPGMTGQSLLPVAAKAEGMDMPALVTKFVDMVVRDYGLERKSSEA